MTDTLISEKTNCLNFFGNSPFDIRFDGMLIRIIQFEHICNNIIQQIDTYHIHKSFEFHYISAGEAMVDVENILFQVKKGDFYITTPYVRHKQTPNPDTAIEEYCIKCEIAFSNTTESLTSEETRILQKYSINSLYTHYQYTEAMLYNFSLIEKLLGEKPCGYKLKIETLILLNIIDSLRISYSLYQANRSDCLDRIRIIKIKNFLQSNYCNPITIQNAADLFNLSSRQLDRILLKEYNMSFFQYLTDLRAQTALQLLENKQESISSIAIHSGFTSYQQMYRVLKRYRSSMKRK